MNLADLSLPFSPDDIEWRVSRSGMGQKGIFCMVLAYITARGIQSRLDDVCGPENWKLEEPRILDVNGKSAFAVGISIRVDSEWITKWDVSEPTRVENIDPAKAGFSRAMKRAGAQWQIGRYLYRLDETFADVSEQPPAMARAWKYARLPERHGGAAYYWKPPSLPGWALPMEPEHEIKDAELNELKKAWRDKFAAESKNPADLREGFTRFVSGVAGEFPNGDYTCWTRMALEQCQERIDNTQDPEGVSSNIPFDS